MSMQHGNFSPNLSVGMGIGLFFLSTTPFLCCVAYWIYYLKRHLYLFSTTGQKIGYGLFTCVMLAILGPSIFPLLIALVLLSIAISIALFLLSVVMTIIALFDGGGSKKRRFSLDNGDEVTEKSQFIEIFYGMETTPVKDYIDDSFPGEWGTEDKDGNGVKVIRTTNFTNSGKLNLADVVTRSIEDRKVVRKQIKKYDTILERSGGTADNPVGRVVLFEEDNLFLCNNFTQVLRFKDVDPRFAFYALYYFYQTNRTAIRSMGSKTTGIQNLNMSKYLEIGIPNASDEDQKAFVTIAEQADKSEFVGCKSQFIEMYYNTHNKQTLESVCPIMNKGITPKYVESSSVLVINQACIHWDGQRLGNIKYHKRGNPS